MLQHLQPYYNFPLHRLMARSIKSRLYNLGTEIHMFQVNPECNTLLSSEALGGSFVSQNHISSRSTTQEEKHFIQLVRSKMSEIPAPSFLSKAHWGIGQWCACQLNDGSTARDSSGVGSVASSVSGVKPHVPTIQEKALNSRPVC